MNKLASCTILALLSAGCGRDDGTHGSVSSDVKEFGRDTAQAAKEVGHDVGESLSASVAALESWSKSAASNVAESGDQIAQDVSARMPELETMDDQTKAKLSQGGAEARAATERLDIKLATLKDRLGTLTHGVGDATKDMKDDVLAAFNDLVAEIRSGLST